MIQRIFKCWRHINIIFQPAEICKWYILEKDKRVNWILFFQESETREWDCQKLKAHQHNLSAVGEIRMGSFSKQKRVNWIHFCQESQMNGIFWFIFPLSVTGKQNFSKERETCKPIFSKV